MKPALLMIFLLSSFAALAQLSVSGGAGMGTFRMQQLKKYSRDLQAATPVTTKTFGNYGAYIGYELALTYKLADRHGVGLAGSFISTGSLTTRTDYSGSIDYRHQVSTKMLAVHYDWDIRRKRKLKISPSIRAGALFTKYHFEYEIKLNDAGNPPIQERAFHATSLMFSPGLMFRYQLTDVLAATADLRYLFDLKAELRYDNDEKIRLVDGENTPTSADWSGLRGMLSIEYRFKKKGER